MEKFEVILKNEKIKSYRRITLFLVAINTVFFIYFIFDNDLRKIAMLAVGVIILFAAFSFYKTKKANQSFFLSEWVFFLKMLLWIQFDNYWMASVCMILFLLCTLATHKLTYEFSSESIKKKNFPRDKYSWDKISNLILKDNVLTMDFKNNKIIQAEIENENINETEFNDFVRKLMKENNK
jgi:predicted membrane protein